MIIVFLFISAPVSAHMLAKTALHLEQSNVWNSLRDEPGRKS
jgi:multisubunit Na+/H+ antiporter MnhG subunit